MGVSEIRSNLIKLLNSIDDERLLLAVQNFLENRENSEEGKMWRELTDEQKKIVLEAYNDSEDEANLVDDKDVWADLK